MHVLFVSSEVTPFARTGGLADVCGALPRELDRAGVEVTLIMPAYRQIQTAQLPIEATDIQFDIPIGGSIIRGGLLRGTLPDSSVRILFVDQPDYFDRRELYGERQDYADNCARFTFFCRAVLETVRTLERPVDVIHCHDWHTGLIPAYLKLEYGQTPGYAAIRSLLTIHNLAYQGRFGQPDMQLTGLDWKYFNWKQMEFHGQLNLLKTGIVFADRLSTVSPRYAREIQSAQWGQGLDGVLRQRGHLLTGILNGIDYSVWSPEQDPQIVRNYTSRDWREGKAVCKADVQQAFGLPVQPDVPLIGQIGRLARQKGWDLLAEVIGLWPPERPVQWALLGQGERAIQRLLERLARRHPRQVAVKTVFSDRLAHQLEAGADLILMPSQHEPCGLNQLYGLRYGTPPVVRATGGLADTVVDTTPRSLAERTANGFVFQDYDARAMQATLERATELFSRQPEVWTQVVEQGMRQDWSWSRGAQAYVDLYRQLRPDAD